MILTTKNIILTNEVSDKVRRDINFRSFINKCIGRHFKLDFGDVDEHDKEFNLKNARTGGRVLSVYNYDLDNKIYVVTEADRSLTTVLFSREY